jgi:hypothetical protein
MTKKRADIQVSTLNDTDIWVTRAGCETYKAAAGGQPGATATKAEESKQKDHEKKEAKGFSLAPFGTEGNGCLGKQVEEFLRSGHTWQPAVG